MNKLFGIANKHYKRLQYEFSKTIKECEYFAISGIYQDDIGQFQRSIISIDIFKKDLENLGRRNIGGGFIMTEGSSYSPIASVKIRPITMEKTEVVLLTTDEQIKQIMKSLEVFFDGDIPEVFDAPFEVIKKRGASADEVFYLKAWLVFGPTAKHAAKRILETYETLNRKICAIRKEYTKSIVPRGQAGRMKFKKEFSFHLKKWEEELGDELKKRK